MSRHTGTRSGDGCAGQERGAYMGWTVLYIAFGIVALWLLGEVLLQYKARLRWRLLAFTGFLGVVARRPACPSVFVIVLGAIAFAVGQTYVTLSFRRGFSTGWALGGRPGASRRRRAQPASRRPAAEPVLEVSDLQYERRPAADQRPYETAATAETPVYAPEPMPRDRQYGVYTTRPGRADTATSRSPLPARTTGGSTASTARPRAARGPGARPRPTRGVRPADQAGYADRVYAAAVRHGAGQQQYAAYSDPYIGSGGQAYGTYGSYDSFGGQQSYADPLDRAVRQRTPRPAGSGSRSSATASQPYRPLRAAATASSSRYDPNQPNAPEASSRYRWPQTTPSSSPYRLLTARARLGPAGSPEPEPGGSLRAPEVLSLHDQSGHQRARHPGVREPAAGVRPAARQIEARQPGGVGRVQQPAPGSGQRGSGHRAALGAGLPRAMSAGVRTSRHSSRSRSSGHGPLRRP